MLQLMKIFPMNNNNDVEELQDIANNMDECVDNVEHNENDDMKMLISMEMLFYDTKV